jgi:hypothetical protein
MFKQKTGATQKSGAQGAPNASQKLHSVHVLPSGRDFVGKADIGGKSYQVAFSPQTAEAVSGKLVLTGAIKFKAPAGQQKVANGVSATLLATQGSITAPSALSRQFSASLKPPQSEPSSLLPITDWTGYYGSVAAMYLRLSPLDARALGVPADLSSVQLNARLYATSDLERDLHWLYSALTESIYGGRPNPQLTADYLGAVNQILKA